MAHPYVPSPISRSVGYSARLRLVHLAAPIMPVDETVTCRGAREEEGGRADEEADEMCLVGRWADDEEADEDDAAGAEAVSGAPAAVATAEEDDDELLLADTDPAPIISAVSSGEKKSEPLDLEHGHPKNLTFKGVCPFCLHWPRGCGGSRALLPS